MIFFFYIKDRFFLNALYRVYVKVLEVPPSLDPGVLKVPSQSRRKV